MSYSTASSDDLIWNVELYLIAHWYWFKCNEGWRNLSWSGHLQKFWLMGIENEILRRKGWGTMLITGGSAVRFWKSCILNSHYKIWSEKGNVTLPIRVGSFWWQAYASKLLHSEILCVEKRLNLLILQLRRMVSTAMDLKNPKIRVYGWMVAQGDFTMYTKFRNLSSANNHPPNALKIWAVPGKLKELKALPLRDLTWSPSSCNHWYSYTFGPTSTSALMKDLLIWKSG